MSIAVREKQEQQQQQKTRTHAQTKEHALAPNERRIVGVCGAQVACGKDCGAGGVGCGDAAAAAARHVMALRMARVCYARYVCAVCVRFLGFYWHRLRTYLFSCDPRASVCVCVPTHYMHTTQGKILMFAREVALR